MKVKKLISLVLITIILTTSISSVFATSSNENQDLQIATEASNSSVDIFKVPPTTAKTNPSSTTITINNTNAEKTTNSKQSTLATLPSFATIKISASTDLRTITVTVNTTGIITPITYFSGYINIRNYNGVCTSSTKISGSLFYNNTFTITKPITATVEESITLQTCSFTQALEDYTVPDITTIRTYQLGGSYNSILNAMGGDRHHCFASEVYSSATVNKYNSSKVKVGTVSTGTAPCILMTPEDHMRTASWGSGAAAVVYRNSQLKLVNQGKYIAAMQMDIDDIHAKFGSKYNDAIAQMWNYVLFTLYWYQ